MLLQDIVRTRTTRGEGTLDQLKLSKTYTRYLRNVIIHIYHNRSYFMEIEWMRKIGGKGVRKKKVRSKQSPQSDMYIVMNLPLCRCFNSHKRKEKSIFKWMENFKWATFMWKTEQGVSEAASVSSQARCPTRLREASSKLENVIRRDYRDAILFIHVPTSHKLELVRSMSVLTLHRRGLERIFTWTVLVILLEIKFVINVTRKGRELTHKRNIHANSR